MKTIATTHIVASSMFAILIGLVSTTPALAGDEFYGKIESRPDTNVGLWTIGGKQIQVTDKTELETDHGAMVVGACVEVEHKKGVASEIESAKPAKCEK